MSTNKTLFPSGARMAASGSVVWMVLLAGVYFNRFRLSIFDLLFLLAPWVAAPLALSLVPATNTSRLSALSASVLKHLLFPGAALTTLSFFLRDGRWAGALICVWLIVAFALALDGLHRLFTSRMKSLPDFCFAAGEGYALVGALWLLASRLGLQPVGFHEPIVLLTAIHFHYAGLMAAVLAGLVASRLGPGVTSLYLRVALSCAVLGPGLLGLAFLAGPKWKLAAVGLMVIGECGVALGTFRIGLSDAGGIGGRLLLAGSACVIFGMALAGIWAVGEYPLHAFVNLEQMARYHGVLNSVGFGLCSLVGWTFLRSKSPPRDFNTERTETSETTEQRSETRKNESPMDRSAAQELNHADSTPGETVVITGAFSYTGKYATRLLLGRGFRIRTLTNHPGRTNSFGEKVEVFPYNFGDPEQLTQTLRGASTLINTYWVRFPRGASTFKTAVENTRTLIRAAKSAGVKRIVHVSIANPSLESNLGYYKGKAQLEQAVMESGLSYKILRPTVIFGLEDILINNIAWFVRRFPVFGIPGDGRYGIRPIYVEDMARLLADAVEQESNAVQDAVGPETYTFEELVKLIAGQLGRRIRLVHLPMPAAYVSTRLTGWFVGDVVLTWEEYKGLMGNLLAAAGPSTGETCLSQWLAANREQVGTSYASEVARHFAICAA